MVTTILYITKAISASSCTPWR